MIQLGLVQSSKGVGGNLYDKFNVDEGKNMVDIYYAHPFHYSNVWNTNINECDIIGPEQSRTYSKTSIHNCENSLRNAQFLCQSRIFRVIRRRRQYVSPA